MKKLLFFLSLVLAAAITSCSNKEEELKSIVKAINRDCPQDFGSVVINGLKYDGREREVLMTVTVGQDNILKMESLDQTKDVLKNNLLGSWAADPGARRLARAIADADAKFAMLMRQNGNEFKMTVENSDLRDLASGKVKALSANEYITNCVITTKAQCPKEVDEITTLADIEYKDDFVIYYYEIDESEFDVDELDEEGTKEVMIESFRNCDRVTKALIIKCKEANCGFRFIYHGKRTDQNLVISILPNEL